MAAGGAGGHHGVEELIEAMADDTTLYKISPWYSGGELFDLAPMSEDVAKPIFSQILDAVSFVHSKGACMIRHGHCVYDVCVFGAVSLVCSSGAVCFSVGPPISTVHHSAVLIFFWGALLPTSSSSSVFFCSLCTAVTIGVGSERGMGLHVL